MPLCKENQKNIPGRLTWVLSSSPDWQLSMWFVFPHLYLLLKCLLVQLGIATGHGPSVFACLFQSLQYLSIFHGLGFFSSGGGILCFVLSFWRPLAYCYFFVLWGLAFSIGFLCAIFDLDVWPTRNCDRFPKLFFRFLALFCQYCKKSHSLLWKNSSLILSYR